MSFLLFGPLCPDPSQRINFLDLEESLDPAAKKAAKKANSRKEARKQQTKEKGAVRKAIVDLTDDTRNARGVSIGTSSLKEIAIISQSERRLSNQVYEQELLKHQTIMASLNQQMTSATALLQVAMNQGVKSMIEKYDKKVDAIDEKIQYTQSQIMNLSRESTSPGEVSEFLKRGREAVGLDGDETSKKSKADETSGDDDN